MSELPSNMATSVVVLKLPDELRDDLQKIRSYPEFLEVLHEFRHDLRTGPAFALHWTKQESRKSQDRYVSITTSVDITACTSTIGISST